MSELTKYQAKLLWFQAFTGWEPVLDDPGEDVVFKAADVEQVIKDELARCQIDDQECDKAYTSNAVKVCQRLLASLGGKG